MRSLFIVVMHDCLLLLQFHDAPALKTQTASLKRVRCGRLYYWTLHHKWSYWSCSVAFHMAFV